MTEITRTYLREHRVDLASFPGLLTPAFVACAVVMRRRPGNEARVDPHSHCSILPLCLLTIFLNCCLYFPPLHSYCALSYIGDEADQVQGGTYHSFPGEAWTLTSTIYVNDVPQPTAAQNQFLSAQALNWESYIIAAGGSSSSLLPTVLNSNPMHFFVVQSSDNGQQLTFQILSTMEVSSGPYVGTTGEDTLTFVLDPTNSCHLVNPIAASTDIELRGQRYWLSSGSVSKNVPGITWTDNLTFNTNGTFGIIQIVQGSLSYGNSVTGQVQHIVQLNNSLDCPTAGQFFYPQTESVAVANVPFQLKFQDTPALICPEDPGTGQGQFDNVDAELNFRAYPVFQMAQGPGNYFPLTHAPITWSWSAVADFVDGRWEIAPGSGITGPTLTTDTDVCYPQWTNRSNETEAVKEGIFQKFFLPSAMDQ